MPAAAARGACSAEIAPPAEKRAICVLAEVEIVQHLYHDGLAAYLQALAGGALTGDQRYRVIGKGALDEDLAHCLSNRAGGADDGDVWLFHVC